MGVTTRNILVGLAIAVLAAVAVSSGSASSRRAGHVVRTYSTGSTLPLRTSLDDPFTLTGPQRILGFAKARAAGASYVRIIAAWNEIAPKAPPSGTASDPNSRGYSWEWLDVTLVAAEKAGLTPILDIARAPAWAQAGAGKGGAGAPKASLLQQFAKALALHFDGNHNAPPVHVFQV